jgi:undecaprenyl-diphosphatase
VKEWYKRWLSDEGYLGLHLVIGFFIALLAGFCFQMIAAKVFGSPGIRTMDAQAEAFAKSIATSRLNTLMLMITFVGNRIVLILLSVLIGLLLYLRGSHRRLYTFGSIMAGGGLLSQLLKSSYHRPRPPQMEFLIEAYGYSFPSGHAMGSMLLFGGLAYVLFFTFERHFVWRILGPFFCLVAVLLIGASRVYLGVHYLSDVVAGFLAGLGWIGICVSGTEAWIRWRNRQGARPFSG